jgi:GMP synthase-like glutamine amidotransferase
MLRRTTRAEEDDNDNDENTFKPIDAILITGSAASAYYQGERYQWIAVLQAFIRQVWTQYPAVKMFGSCFGHQILAQALLVDYNTENNSNNTQSPRVQVEACPLGYEVGIHPITLNPTFAADTSLGQKFSEGLARHDRKLCIQLIHGDRVIGFGSATTSTLPNPWINIGSTLLSPIQGLYYPGRVLTYQGHFEFDVFVNTETVLEFGRRSSWNAQVVSQHLQQISSGSASSETDDSDLAAEVVLRFLTGDHDHDRNPDGECSANWTAKDVKIEFPTSIVENGLATPPDEVMKCL